MKKILLTLCLFAAALTINAQPMHKTPLKAALHKLNVPKGEKPLFDPEGAEEQYIMAYTDDNGFGSTDYTNGKVYVRKSDDGTTWYFNGLTPGGNRSYKGAPESWLVGTKEGNEIVIQAGQVLVQNQSKTLYFEVVHAADDGAVTSFEKELRLTVADDGSLTAPADDILSIYEDAETEDDAGFFGFFYNLSLKPMGELVRFAFPEGVTPQTYVLSGTDAYGTQSSRFVKAAISGRDFFISGLSSLSPDEVYQGTVSDGMVSIPSFQIVKDADLFYYRIVPVTTDEDYNPTMLRSIDFMLSDDNYHTFTLSPANAYLCEASYDLQSFASTLAGVRIKYYEGDKAAKPATPEVVEWDSYNDALIFTVPTTDVDGEYINPDKLTYRVYLDGKRYTFTTADYERLTEDMDELPYAFTDNFDIVLNGIQKVIYFHNIKAKLIQVKSVYTVDGVATSSDFATYDFDPTSVSSNAAAKQPVSIAYTSPEGARLSAPRRGSLVLKTTTYADGSRTTVKEIVK